MPVQYNQLFRTIATHISRWAGSPFTFMIAVILILIWGTSGRFFGYSDTWQLVINTSTTIITFLMVFLIQNTQNRDSRAMHLKLDELIRVEKGARNGMMNVEEISDEDLEALQEEFRVLHEKYEEALKKRKSKPKSA